eukprot:jgi/Bigna1/125824/aug1.1_g532
MDAGEIVIYKTAVAIMSLLKQKILEAPFGKVLKLLATEPQKLEIKQLFAAISKVRVSSAFRRKLDMLVKNSHDVAHGFVTSPAVGKPK